MNVIFFVKNNRKGVFNIFQKLDNIDSYEGTGISLAQYEKIVELHDGEIFIDGISKSGTKLSFTLKKYHRYDQNDQEVKIGSAIGR